MICVDDPVCSMLCPDDKKGVTSHCTACFRHTRAPLPCDVSGSGYSTEVKITFSQKNKHLGSNESDNYVPP